MYRVVQLKGYTGHLATEYRTTEEDFSKVVFEEAAVTAEGIVATVVGAVFAAILGSVIVFQMFSRLNTVTVKISSISDPNEFEKQVTEMIADELFGMKSMEDIRQGHYNNIPPLSHEIRM